MEYWQEKLAEFQEALVAEFEMEEQNEQMIKLLKFEIETCQREIDVRS